MTRSPVFRFAIAALTAAAFATSASAFAWGTAAPMSVSAIEAQAPVASLHAMTPASTASHSPKAAAKPVSRLRAWIAALRLRVDGAIEVALH